MKDTLQPGITHQFTFTVTDAQTVPALYPESDDFQNMPRVFATGFMVGFIEWACIQALKPHLDHPGEFTVGTHIDVSHLAATPPGLEATARVKLLEVNGRHLVFEVEAHDGLDRIAKGRHERFVVNHSQFETNLAKKIAKI